MAHFIRTATVGATLDSAKLAELFTTAQVGGWSPPVGQNIYCTSLAPSEMTGQAMWWDMTNQLLKIPVMWVGATPASLWLSIGPDSWEIPVYNITGTTLRFGEAVSFSWSTTGIHDIIPQPPNTIYTTRVQVKRTCIACRNFAGVLQASLPPNQFGRAVSYGFGIGLFDLLSPNVVADGTEQPSLFSSTTYTGVLAHGGIVAGELGCCLFRMIGPATSFAPDSYKIQPMPMFIKAPWGMQGELVGV